MWGGPLEVGGVVGRPWGIRSRVEEEETEGRMRTRGLWSVSGWRPSPPTQRSPPTKTPYKTRREG